MNTQLSRAVKFSDQYNAKIRLRLCLIEMCRLAAMFGALVLGTASAEQAAAKRPNVLFLFTDDQRADTIAALGNEHIQTPNLDRLVRAGTVFHNAYCMGGNVPAVCLPSRTMLLSGLSLFHLKDRRDDAPTLPRAMKAAGYVTYHHGKRGNSPHDIHKQFDYSHYLEDGKTRTSGFPGKVTADDAIDFIQKYDDERPFFMYLAFSGPHDPRVAAPEYLARYDAEQLPLPRNYLPVHPFDNGEMTIRDERLAPWPRTPEVVRRHLRDYYAVITCMDAQVGRILDALRAKGQADNTLIIFSSDHGLAIGSHGLMGKQNIYEDGMKAPLIFAGPGIPQGGSSDALAYLFDIFPTICELVGADPPAGIDGKSLAPVIAGKQPQVRDALFTVYRGVQRAVRNDRWKLIRYPQINRTQLFDLAADPDETKDLAGDPAHAAQVEQMTALLQRQQAEAGDDLPLVSKNPKDGVFTPPSSP